MKGMLWGAGSEDVLVLVPCGDVHSFFMRQPLDLAFVGADGAVVGVARGFPPWRRLRVRGASMVIERFSKEGPWFEVGEQLFAPAALRAGALELPVGEGDDL